MMHLKEEACAPNLGAPWQNIRQQNRAINHNLLRLDWVECPTAVLWGPLLFSITLHVLPTYPGAVTLQQSMQMILGFTSPDHIPTTPATSHASKPRILGSALTAIPSLLNACSWSDISSLNVACSSRWLDLRHPYWQLSTSSRPPCWTDPISEILPPARSSMSNPGFTHWRGGSAYIPTPDLLKHSPCPRDYGKYD